MHLKLWHKFALALIVTSALSLITALYFSQQSFKHGFLAYLNAQEHQRVEYLAEQLIGDYQYYDNWQFISHDHRRWQGYIRDVFQEARDQGLFPEVQSVERNQPTSRDRNFQHSPKGDFNRPPPVGRNLEHSPNGGFNRLPPRDHGERPSPRGKNLPHPPNGGFNRLPPRDGSENLTQSLENKDATLQRPPPRRRPPPPISNGQRPLIKVALADSSGEIIAGGVDVDEQNMRFALRLDGVQLGELIVKTVEQFSSQGEQEFVKQQRDAFMRIAGLALLLTAILAWLFGRLFYARIRPLSALAGELTQGLFDSRINSDSQDEIGQLASDLDQLAATLEKNRSSRQRWIADISHELRTPLSVLQGELEALQDGVRPLEPAAISSLSAEAHRLNHLVEDLYQLSMADIGALSYRFEEVDLAGLIENEIQLAASNLSNKQIQVTLEEAQQQYVNGDQARLGQLFKNLIQNTLRYTDAPGKLEVTFENVSVNGDDYLQVKWSDTAPGISTDQHEVIFERMVRIEKSRSRETGGAGLGLAIVEEIVRAHNASIQAVPSRLGGLSLEILFPIEPISKRGVA